jgi:tetratricopeptide (TPR) repeat protein
MPSFRLAPWAPALLLLLTPACAVAADGYAGSIACAPCHEKELAAWRGSDHDRAMEEATEASVLGRFDGSEFAHGQTRARFFRRDGRFWIHTDGPDGKPADFAVRYTFGVRPLQQYLLELPGGRLQASTVAWDSRPKEEGGQRWFRLQPDEPMPAGDVMHWTGISQSWNSMCADCHSTDLAKNYSAANDTWASKWAEIDVACEACHGPAAAHVAWASTDPKPQADNFALTVDLRGDGAAWTRQPGAAIAVRSKPRAAGGELDTCAPCHSRRSQIVADPVPGAAFLDGYLPALIEDGLYFPDGQIRDEVFDWGSFVQSRMYAAGVRCGDCHDAHTLEVRGGVAGVCLQCHAPETYAAKDHHGHEPGTLGSQCVDCHMPERTYMEVDARRDHSFGVPRPDLTKVLGVPNACGGCHADRSPDWATEQIRAWRGGEVGARPSFAPALARAWAGDAVAVPELAAIAADAAMPAITRASAVAALAPHPGPEAAQAIAAAARDGEPLVRMAAARAAANLPPQVSQAVIGALAGDPVRAVRIEAGRTLAPLLEGELEEAERRTLERAIEEYRAAQLVSAERPGSQVNLGNLAAATGDAEAAEAAYRRAIAVGPYFIPAFVNLADLYRALGREGDAAATLRAGLGKHPGAADLQHALGLSLVRSGDLPAALVELKQATLAAPDNTRYAYVYAVALHSAGRSREALDVAQAALVRRPADPTLRELVASLGSASGGSGVTTPGAGPLR